MNFLSLKYFLVVAEELNITHAAQKLFITQQSLSAHISHLEEELNLKLFDRNPSLSLTQSGRMLVEYSRKILDMEKQIMRTADDINGNVRGEIRVGISHTCGRAVLPHFLPKFNRTHPLVSIHLVEGSMPELEGLLSKGELDLIIVFSPVSLNGYSSVKLLDERMFLVVPKSMLKAEFGACYEAIKSECQRNLDISLFEKMPFVLLKRGNRIRNIFDNYLKKSGFEPNVILETNNAETAFALAQNCMGITVYPEMYYFCINAQEKSALDNVYLFPINDPSTYGYLEIGWIEGRYKSKAMDDFISICREAADEIQSIEISLHDPSSGV